MLLEKIKISIFFFPILMFFMIFVAKKLDFVDKPNHRKIHKSKVANITGITICIYLIFIVISSEFSFLLEKIIIIGLVIALIGFLDDRKEITPSMKLMLILLPSSYLVFNGFELTDIGIYEYIGFLYLGKFSIIFTLLSVLLLINSINYIDGTDGLLIGYTITALIYFYFLSGNQNQYSQIFLIFVYILIISLFFNFLPIKSGFKSFLGDSGSLFIGFFISFTIIFLYKYHSIHPALLIWVCWLPIYDFLYVTLNRFVKKQDFYNPDKSHLHHYVLKYFSKNHFKTFLCINLINLLVISIGYFLSMFIGKIYSLFSFILFFFIFVFARLKLENFKIYKN